MASRWWWCLCPPSSPRGTGPSSSVGPRLAGPVRERREYVLPARFDDTPLPGLLSDMITVDLRTGTPQQFAAMIVGKLADLGIAAPAPSADAGGPARDAGAARPAGAVRVAEVDLRRLPASPARNWSGPGTPGRPSGTSAARSANGPATPATHSAGADLPEPSSGASLFRKLDAVPVLTVRLLPAPLVVRARGPEPGSASSTQPATGGR